MNTWPGVPRTKGYRLQQSRSTDAPNPHWKKLVLNQLRLCPTALRPSYCPEFAPTLPDYTPCPFFALSSTIATLAPYTIYKLDFQIRRLKQSQ